MVERLSTKALGGCLIVFLMLAGSACQHQYLDAGSSPVSPGGVPTPFIVSVSPGSGAVGAAVTVSGISFGATQGASTVTIGGRVATPTTWSISSIVAPVPAGATSGTVVVNVGGLGSNTVQFNVTP